MIVRSGGILITGGKADNGKCEVLSVSQVCLCLIWYRLMWAVLPIGLLNEFSVAVV